MVNIKKKLSKIMSVDLKYFIETKGSDGKWRLVKWLDYEGNVENERYGSATLRDSLTGYRWTGFQSLPDDISDELKTILMSMAEKRGGMFNDPEYKPDWTRMFECISLGSLFERCNEEHAQLKESIINRAGKTAMDDIARKLDRVEKIVSGKQVPPRKKKRKDDEEEVPIDYRTALDFILEDSIFDYVYLMCECYKIKGIADNFMPWNRWDEGENIRIIYYCS